MATACLTETVQWEQFARPSHLIASASCSRKRIVPVRAPASTSCATAWLERLRHLLDCRWLFVVQGALASCRGVSLRRQRRRRSFGRPARRPGRARCSSTFEKTGDVTGENLQRPDLTPLGLIRHHQPPLSIDRDGDMRLQRHHNSADQIGMDLAWVSEARRSFLELRMIE